MGNSIGRKRNMTGAPSKELSVDSHSVSLMSSSLNMTVELPREIEEDLERRKIDSFKALDVGSKEPSSTRRISRLAPALDLAQEYFEKMRKLDVPAMMLPKPWSEVDQILSKPNASVNNNSDTVVTPKYSPLPRQVAVELVELQPETIDMWQLMEDLDEEDEDGNKSPMKKALKHEYWIESLKSEDFTPKKIRTLESSLSFSTIHTVKEVEGGSGKPETVTSILRRRTLYELSGRSSAVSAKKTNASAAIATTSRKVNMSPRLLARMESFT